MVAAVGAISLTGSMVSFLFLVIGSFFTRKSREKQQILVQYESTSFVASFIMQCLALCAEDSESSIGILPLVIATASIVCAIIGVYKVGKFESRTTASRISLSSIDAMDGRDFEHFSARLLRDLGYSNVQVTRASGDYGVDIIAYSGGIKRVFQCKRTTKKLGIKPVQEVYAGKIHYGASVAVVVTNSYFSANAVVLAKETGVALWDRDMLKHLMRKVEKERDGKRQKQIDRAKWCCDKLESSFTWMRERLQDAAGEIERRSKRRALWKTFYGTEGHDMAAIIGAGRYVFGEDLPAEKYNLKALSGDGGIEFQTGGESEGTVPTKWMRFGVADGCAKSYFGLSMPDGWWFELEDDVVAKITRAKPLEIDEE